jgi:ferrous iron transport protein A
VNNTAAPACACTASPDAFVCPLSQVQPGTVCRIKQLLTSPELSQRLREMGLGEDQKIRLLSQQRSLICQVCNARLGLSAELAEAILVERLATRPPGA